MEKEKALPCHIMPKFEEVTSEDISKFFEGSDPMQHIVNIELPYNSADAEIVFYDENGEKKIKKEGFKPFAWAKNSACIRMFQGQRGTLRAKMREYGIRVKALYTCTEDNPYPHEKLDSGYKYLFYATHKMSMGKFQNFFKEAGTPLKNKKRDNNDMSSQEFMTLQPVEEFMIQTGKRYFKGYDNYDDIKRCAFDLETEGTDPKRHRIIQISIHLNKGYDKVLNIEGETKEELDENEILCIIEFLKIISDMSPDVIFGHNSENFDWNFFIQRCKILGFDFTELSAKLFPVGIYKQKTATTLKLGGEVETYYPTVIKYFNVVDSIHAVRRAMATDSSFESARLKYATKYLHLNKKNRVYVPGNIISKTWKERNKIFAFNNTDGDWYKYDTECDFKLKTLSDFKEEIKSYPTFGDYKAEVIENIQKEYEESVSECEDYDYDIPTDEELLETYHKQYIFDADVLYNNYMKSLKGIGPNGTFKLRTMNVMLDGYALVDGKYIVERYLLDDVWETDKVELKLHETDFQLTKIMPTTFMRVCTMGTATQWKLIMLTWAYQHDLAIPSLGKNRKFTGGLSRLLITGYLQDILKLDYSALYPTTQLTWNIESEVDIMHIMLQLLLYMVKGRDKFKALKVNAEDSAEEIYHQLEVMSETDPYFNELTVKREALLADVVNFNNQQLILKKLANSYFGSYGCPSVFPWASLVGAEKTTCCGRMLLRVMIYYFHTIGERNFPDLPPEEQMKYNYIPIVGDTDGFDFKMPEKFRYTEENPYIGKGLNRHTKLGKEYFGPKGDVAEFGDTVLCHSYNGSNINLSGLDIDEFVTASINVARKNYLCLMKRDGSIKKVGNTMKSRKMSGYLQKFINKACDMLIQGDGYGFLHEYYNMIDDIFNYRISVRDIASKGNIKKSLDEYKEGCKELTASGSKKSRQAWYELAIENKLDVHPGDTVYYINVGQKKGDGDAQRKTHQFIKNPDNPNEEIELTTRLQTRLVKAECIKEGIIYKTLKSKDIKARIKKYIVREEDEIIINCKMVSNDIIDSEKEYLCSDVPELAYNVDKYITQFNNRIRPLLVCFSTNIRDRILITNPDDTPSWTREDAVLVHGQPMKEGDEDKYEVLITPERNEIKFWESINERPPFLDIIGIDWDKLIEEYHETLKKEADELFQAEDKKYLDALEKLTKDDIEKFNDDGKLPTSLTNIVTLSPKDMKFYFINIPDMTPTTGGYIFNDMRVDMEEKGIEVEAVSILD